MYCTNCGTENQQDAGFCSKCGAPLKGVVGVVDQQTNYEIRLNKNDINKIGQLAAELQQLDNVEIWLAKKQRELAYANESINRNNRNISNNRDLILIMGGISFGIVMMLLFVLYSISALRGEYFFPGKISLLASIIVAVVVDKKIYPKLKTSVDKRLVSQGKKFEEKQTKAKTECEQIERDKQQLINVISNKIDIIPPKYRTQIAVQYIYETLINMRASNLKEAFNLYEEQLHRWKMEDSQQRMENLARQQLIAANISAAANVVSASANVATAANTRDIANRTRGGY